MHIHIFWPWELTEKITGTVVVCDVFAATTNIASFLARGAKELLLVNAQTLRLVKNHHPDAWVIGDRGTLPKKIFHASNHPSEVVRLNVLHKTVIYMSANGTRMIEEAFRKGAKRIVTASFTNIDAVASWLREKKTSEIILLPAGEINLPDQRSREDKICAEVLRDILEERDADWESRLKEAERFICANYHMVHPEAEYAVVLARNRYPVVPLCEPVRKGLIRVTDTRNCV